MRYFLMSNRMLLMSTDDGSFLLSICRGQPEISGDQFVGCFQKKSSGLTDFYTVTHLWSVRVSIVLDCNAVNDIFITLLFFEIDYLPLHHNGATQENNFALQLWVLHNHIKVHFCFSCLQAFFPFK